MGEPLIPTAFHSGNDSKGVEAADADFPGFWEACPELGHWGGGATTQPQDQAMFWGFPAGPVGGSICCQCRGHGFDPWSRKIPPTAEQQSLCEPQLPSPCPKTRAPQERPWQWGAHAQQLERALEQQ